MKKYRVSYLQEISATDIEEELNYYSKNGYELEKIEMNDGVLIVVSKKEKLQSKQNKSEKLIDSALAQFEPQCLKKPEYWAREFISHRRKIKKSVKTERPVLLFLKELDKLCENGYDVANAVETMKNREWQTLKYEYIAGKDAGDNGVAFM